MRLLAIALLLSCITLCSSAQTTSQTASTSDAQALYLAHKAIAALTGGSSISDVTLDANVISKPTPDASNGTGTFRARGTTQSPVDLSVATWTRSDIRNTSNGVPTGKWITNGATPRSYASHNSRTDASWFFPALSSLTQTANSNFISSYVGQERL